MSESSTTPGGDELQFDRAVDASGTPGSLICSSCSSPIRMYYYHVNGETTCSTCKAALDRSGGAGSTGGGSGMAKAVLFGVGAAIAGAAIYYAVMEYLDLEIGIVAILIGYMVGHSVRKATMGHGSRRFQVLAAGLTYVAVALAYAPFAIGGIMNPDAGVSADSSAVPASAGPSTVVASADSADPAVAAPTSSDSASATVTASTDSVALESSGADAPVVEESTFGAAGMAVGFAGILIFVLALPIVVILGSMPGGLISALIIGFGMHQAWTMTAGQATTVTGPFRIGTEAPTASA